MKLALSLGVSSVLVFAICLAQEVDVGSDEQRAAGKQIYDKRCAQCHGIEGDGNGIARAYFKPAPRDFTFGTYKIRTTESGEMPTHDDLEKIIKEGMPYTGMPAWPGLSDGELSNVVYYLKTFTELFADPDMAVPPLDIPKAPRFSEESARLGKELFEENKCADCHGEAGRGDGESSPTLKDDWDQPIKPADLTKRWTFRGGSTREDIYRTFTTGLNGTPMPSYADLIETEDRWYLVDYVYSLSRDDPEYSTVVVAVGLETTLDLDRGKDLFADATPAFIPVFGQVIEPGRVFYPGASAVDVRAVYSTDEIAIMLTWNDMTMEATGENSPSMKVARFDPNALESVAEGTFSDAAAVLTPSENRHGSVKPYLLFGDTKNTMDIWFADLARDEGVLFVGRGSQSIDPVGPIEVRSAYEDGEWNVVFKRSRHPEGGYSFDEGSFVPIAFSLWDAFNTERGNKRGMTSWYSMYLKPMETESKAGPIVGYGVLTLLIEIVVIGVVRMRNGRVSASEKGSGVPV